MPQPRQSFTTSARSGTWPATRPSSWWATRQTSSGRGSYQVRVINKKLKKNPVIRRLKCFPEGRSLAISHDCKYVEVSAALDHNVDTLLVGIVKQIRLKMTVEKQRPGNYER